jgi:hypothetical protein
VSAGKPQGIEVLYDQVTDSYTANAPVYLAICNGTGKTREAAIEALVFRLQEVADQRGETIEDLKAKVAELTGRSVGEVMGWTPPAPGLAELVALRKSLQPIDYSPVVGPIKRVDDGAPVATDAVAGE